MTKSGKRSKKPSLRSQKPAKGKKLADAAGRPESAKEQHRTPVAYINVTAMSIQKKQNRKTTRFQHSLLKQKYHIFKE